MKTINALTAILASLFLLSCGEDEVPPPVLDTPILSLEGATFTESNTNDTYTLRVKLDQGSSTNIIVNYAGLSGTAELENDFRLSGNGELIFEAGSTEKTIELTIIGDEVDEPEEKFEVLLLNPVNAQVLEDRATFSILDDDLPEGSLIIPGEGYSTPDSYPGMSLVWADEFEGTVLNTADWTYEIGNGQNGWGNNELQYYQEANTSIVDNDYLVIEARQQSVGAYDYTSSRLVTQGKQEFQFGRIDIRAALPEGQGIWPALWMLGSNFSTTGWPACGEIDIMEMVGHNANTVHATVHFGSNVAQHQFVGNSKTLGPNSSFQDEFHVFSLIWEEDQLQFLMDDQVYHEITPADMNGQPYPFNQPFFFIFNVAVGGDWPGSPNSTTAFPQRMIVDYVRVFQ